MAITVNTMSDSAGITNFASGQLTTDAGAAAALAINVGFTPRHIKLVLVPAAAGPATIYEWHEGMANGTYIDKTGAYATTNGFIVTDRSFTMSATMLAVSSSFVWEAEG